MILNGCAAVAAGPYLSRQQDTRSAVGVHQDFQKQNFEREKARLQPLKWCDELYKFDQSWYGEDANCRAAAEKAATTDKS
jgi:hypothetical protein